MINTDILLRDGECQWSLLQKIRKIYQREVDCLTWNSLLMLVGDDREGLRRCWQRQRTSALSAKAEGRRLSAKLRRPTRKVQIGPILDCQPSSAPTNPWIWHLSKTPSSHVQRDMFVTVTVTPTCNGVWVQNVVTHGFFFSSYGTVTHVLPDLYES